MCGSQVCPQTHSCPRRPVSRIGVVVVVGILHTHARADLWVAVVVVVVVVVGILHTHARADLLVAVVVVAIVVVSTTSSGNSSSEY